MYKGRFLTFLTLLLVVFGMTFAVVIAQNVTGLEDVWRAQIQARQAEAEAERLRVQLDLAQAQAQIENAKGVRTVLEAAARSVDADRRLVSWYSLRGDLRGALAFVGALGLAVCAGIAVALVKGMKHGSTETDK